MKRSLVKHLNVREADASQMTSTIISKSSHARSTDDAELALQSIVADTSLVELKRYHRRHLKVVVTKEIVEVRRSIVYEVLPTAEAAAKGNAPLMYFKCKWSMQFRSNTDEGTVTIRRFYPGVKRDKKDKASAVDERTMGTRARETMLGWYEATQSARDAADSFIEARLEGVFAGPRAVYGYVFPPTAPVWGPTGQALVEAAAACSGAVEEAEYMGVLTTLGKVSLDLREAAEALGGLAVGEAVSEAAMLGDLLSEVVHIDGLEFKPAELGAQKTVKALERHLRGALGVAKDEARATAKVVLHGCTRRRVRADALQGASALCANMRGMVCVVPHTEVQYPLKMRTEGKSGMRPKALCAEARTLYRLSDTAEGNRVWGYLETCVSLAAAIAGDPVDPAPGRITIKLIDKAPQAATAPEKARKRRGSVGETTLKPARNQLEKLQIERGGAKVASTVPNTPSDIPKKAKGDKGDKGEKKSGASTRSGSGDRLSSSESTSTVSSITTSPMSIPESSAASPDREAASPDVLPLSPRDGAEARLVDPTSTSTSMERPEASAKPPLPPGAEAKVNGKSPPRPGAAVNPKIAQALARRFLRKSGFTPPSTPPGPPSPGAQAASSKPGSAPGSAPDSLSPKEPSPKESSPKE